MRSKILEYVRNHPDAWQQCADSVTEKTLVKLPMGTICIVPSQVLGDKITLRDLESADVYVIECTGNTMMLGDVAIIMDQVYTSDILYNNNEDDTTFYLTIPGLAMGIIYPNQPQVPPQVQAQRIDAPCQLPFL